MKIGLGLPVDEPEVLLAWATRADAGPFSTLGLLDRLAWPNPEPLVTLAALAGATTRIRLQTEVLLGPLRDAPLLASQVATIDRLSGGRFTLGLGLGGRADDFTVAGVPFRGRAARFDVLVPELRRLWATGAVGPAPRRAVGPEILFGAFRPAALARVARFGDGLLCAADPSWAGGLFRAVERDWAAAGRPGRPRMVGQCNVALGPQAAVDAARASLTGYYAFTGEPERMSAGLRTTPTAVRAAVDAFTDLGADEVVLYCWATDVDQVDRVAEAVS